MTIETIDNVLYYVWRAGDELPSYQPIGCEIIGGRYSGYKTDIPYKQWNDSGFDMVRWPKLLNDRAQHQRMIDEEFEKMDTFEPKDDDKLFIGCGGNKQYMISHYAQLGAYVKRMMEYVQEQIDKEGVKV